MCAFFGHSLSFRNSLAFFFTSFHSFRSFIRSYVPFNSVSVYLVRVALNAFCPASEEKTCFFFTFVGIVNAAQRTQYNNLEKTRCCCTSSTNIKVFRFVRSQQIITHKREGDFYSSVSIRVHVLFRSHSGFDVASAREGPNET